MSHRYVVIELEREAVHSERIFVEFTKIVHLYSEAKQLLKKGYFLDSLHRVHQSLQHMARLTVLEVGQQPDMLLWKQVKVIDSSVYKLYEELSTSKEPLDKRIELFLLALDFLVLSKLEKGVAFLLDLLASRKEAWTIEEILTHPHINDRSFEMISILERMEKKALVRTQIIDRNGIKLKAYSQF
ncbi:hypothetical protein BEP19_15110 [Ammoniphilus oxalaticus]|uniref:YgxA-like substrate binding domain-containing protein n=1 Tax=Ammoniphilus oxalaticus TaxID=66863 RepID=A0A419SD05_9BACL|nr:hypothetical protein [Ammoniphilus oxalaticus]RKD21009.1 hypothetical protein BEP19_15110 [Ammoniphilus oxalaticus]